MVSSHGTSGKSGNFKVLDPAKVKKSGDKKSRGESGSENAARHSPPHPLKKEKEALRYEFESKVPKGQRTDREKKKSSLGKRGSSGRDRDDSNDRRSSDHHHHPDQPKHLKRLRTGRSSRSEGSSKKPQSNEEDAVETASAQEEKQMTREDAGDKQLTVVAENGNEKSEKAGVEVKAEDKLVDEQDMKQEQEENKQQDGNEARDALNSKAETRIETVVVGEQDEVKAVEHGNDDEAAVDRQVQRLETEGPQEHVLNNEDSADKDKVDKNSEKNVEDLEAIDRKVKEAPAGSAAAIDACKEGTFQKPHEEPQGQQHEHHEPNFQHQEQEQQEQQEQERLENAEPDTSLSLGLSGSHRMVSRRAKSISQAETFSHGVTTSLSLSCSHPFSHNPSCSLTQTSHDNQEFSSASQPVHQETSQSVGGSGRRMDMGDYGRAQGLSQTRGRTLSQPLETSRYSHHSRPKGSFHRKQVKSSDFSRSAGSWERWAEREKAQASSLPSRITVREIVSDHVPLVAQKMQALPLSELEELKNSAKELLECSDKRDEFLHLQRILQSRRDLSSDALHMSHRTQMEILVALKTGILAFLLQETQLKVLIEVFLHLRCRNVQCLNQLPVDNCECKICSQKNGFCNACMCVVCSKFDFEHNTCSWVGCDFCIHWCHTDCGLRKSYIKPGPTIRGAPGTSEMQFHCIACGHTSELYGFVKDVFTSCAKAWNRAVLSKELDCVRRMFHGSEDTRGKQVCWKAGQLVAKLENNSDVGEACNSMLRFFEDGSLEDDNHGAATADRVDPATVLERATLALQTYDRVLEEKRTDAAEMQYERARKKAEIEELESIVRIKQAEAKMFQARADEAAREAEGLQRIVLAKCLKVEEEYATKISKLQLLEAEERRKRKYEDVQLLERGSYNFDMVRKLMNDLQELLRKMETAKRLKAEEVSGVEAYLHRYLQTRAV